MSDKRITILQAPYYPEVTDMLYEGARRVLADKNLSARLLSVEGALEIPQAMAMVETQVEGVIALGCVLRGETLHFELVARLCHRGIQQVALQRGLCAGTAVLACETREQALIRADPQQRDAGGQAARACLRLLEFKTLVS